MSGKCECCLPFSLVGQIRDITPRPAQSRDVLALACRAPMPEIWGPGAVVRLGCCAGTARSAEVQLGGWKNRRASIFIKAQLQRSAKCSLCQVDRIATCSLVCATVLKGPEKSPHTKVSQWAVEQSKRHSAFGLGPGTTSKGDGCYRTPSNFGIFHPIGTAGIAFNQFWNSATSGTNLAQTAHHDRNVRVIISTRIDLCGGARDAKILYFPGQPGPRCYG